MDYVHILFLIKFFDRYGKFFVTLADAGMYSFIIDAANIIMEKEYKDNYFFQEWHKAIIRDFETFKTLLSSYHESSAKKLLSDA